MGDQASPSNNTHPQLFVFGGSGSAAGQSPGTARLHGSAKKGHKAGTRRRTPAATQQLLEPTHQHLVPLLVLRHVQDIPTLVAFSAVSQHFYNLLSHKSGSVLDSSQLPTLLASLRAPKAATTTTTHNKWASTTWQPLRLWSAATRLQCLKWLCSITTAQAINSPEVAQSLLQLFWTAGDIHAKTVVSTLSQAGLRLTPELLLHACQQQHMQGLASLFMLHVLNLPGAWDPLGVLCRCFAGACAGMPGFTNLATTMSLNPFAAIHTVDPDSAIYQIYNLLDAAPWTERWPALTITADMLPLLLSMAFCLYDRACGDAIAELLCSLNLESPSAQHSTAHNASSSRSSSAASGSGGRVSSSSSSSRDSSRDSSVDGCSSSLSSGGASSDGDHCAAEDRQSTMLASLMQQCVTDGRDRFLGELLQSPAPAMLGPAGMTDVLRQVLRRPDLRHPILPDTPPHPLLVSLTALPGASALGPAQIAALLQEAIDSRAASTELLPRLRDSGAAFAELLLQLPGASDLQPGQVFELMSAAVHAYVYVKGTYYSSTNPRLVLALELGRFAATLPPDTVALVKLLKAAMDTPRPYSVLPGHGMPAADLRDGFSCCMSGFSSMGLVGWLHGEHVLQLLRHCAEKKRVWAWNVLITTLPTRRLADSDRHELVVWYKAVVAAAASATPTPHQDPKCTFNLTEATFPTCPRSLLAYMQPADWVEVIAAAISSPLGAPPPGLLKLLLGGNPDRAEELINAAADRRQWEVVDVVAAALKEFYTPSQPLPAPAKREPAGAADATAAAAAATASAAGAAATASTAAATASTAADTAAAAAAATASGGEVQQAPTPAEEPEPVFFECEGDCGALMGSGAAAPTATSSASGTAAATAVEGGVQQPEHAFFECEGDSAAVTVPPVAGAAVVQGVQGGATSIGNLP